MLTTKGLEQTFRVFEDPYNLSKITPPSLGFEVLGKERAVMAKGAEINYRIRWLGLPLRWKTIIREYQPPYLFVDEQAKGPYRLWRHTHTFQETKEGVLVGDRVEYSLPFGTLGRAVHAVVVKRQLQAIFNYRQQKLGSLLGGVNRQVQAPVVERSR